MTVSYTVVISLLYLACGVFIFLLGLTILRIGRSGAPTRATALMLFFAGVGPLLTATGMILEQTLREGSVVFQSMVESFEYLWEFYFPSLMLFALSFPRENRTFRRYPIIGLVVFLPYIFHLAVMMFGDRMLDFVSGLYTVFPADKSVSLGSHEVSVGGFDNLVNASVHILERIHKNMFAVVDISYSVAALWLLWRSRAHVLNPRLASQVRTVGIGLTASVACYTFAKVAVVWSALGLPERASLALVNLSLVASGGTIAYAVVRQQFLGIRHVFRRALLYSGAAVMFAFLYLVVVRPISDFVAQYSTVSRDAFETGFIIVAIIAFQPTLIRTEEILERWLLKGKEDLARQFKSLGDDVASVTSIEELQTVLRDDVRRVLDTSDTHLEMAAEAGRSQFLSVLEEIGEAVRRDDLLRLREHEARSVRRGLLRRVFTPGGERGQGADRPPSVLDRIIGDGSSLSFDVYVPLFRERRCVGFLGLGEKIYGVPYSAEELGHLSVLGTQIGSALHNIQLLQESVERQLFEEELRIARKIQTQLLPGAPPALPGFELCAETVPSRYVGGDYYDFVAVDDHQLVLVVADVSGKGIPASILTATLQAAVRSNADAQTDPQAMLARLNRLLYRNTSAEEFATLFYAVIDLQRGWIRYANAGHDFPFVVNGEGAQALAQSGIVLGTLEDFHYEVSDIAMPENAVLAIYTDGVTECESHEGEYYGTERLKRVLERNASESARQICRAVVDDVRDFGHGDAQDDLTLVVLKRGG